jgi:hypothetical protein
MAAVDNVEFNIVRKVLFIVVSTGNNTGLKTQLDILSSSKLKVRALFNLVVARCSATC